VIEELGDVFKDDETSKLMSGNAIKAANETMNECSIVFAEIDATLKKSKKNTFGRLMLPFRDNKIELLRNHIDKLKSTLQLLMQVLTHAHHVATKKLDREAEAKQKAQIQELIELKKKSARRYEESLMNFSISDSSTVYDDDEPALDQEKLDRNPARDMNMTLNAAAIGSTITPKTLETCVEHVHSLLEDIERLQQTLMTNVAGDDPSEHHQRLIGSYFRARSHLDSVLFSGEVKTSPVAYESPSTYARSNKVHISIQSPMSKTEVIKTIPDVIEGTRMEKKEKTSPEAEEANKTQKAETADQKAEREAEEAEDARQAGTPEQKAKREAENRALFASLRKNTQLGPGSMQPESVSVAFTPESVAIRTKPALLHLETKKGESQAEVDAVVAQMRENMRKVSERGERLDSLQDKTSDLNMAAQGFRRSAKRQQQSGYWSNPLGWFNSSSSSNNKASSQPTAVDTSASSEVIVVEPRNRYEIIPASLRREEMRSTDEVDDLLKEWTTVF
jgi:hypothetical protein